MNYLLEKFMTCKKVICFFSLFYSFFLPSIFISFSYAVMDKEALIAGAKDDRSEYATESAQSDGSSLPLYQTMIETFGPSKPHLTETPSTSLCLLGKSQKPTIYIQAESFLGQFHWIELNSKDTVLATDKRGREIGVSQVKDLGHTMTGLKFNSSNQVGYNNDFFILYGDKKRLDSRDWSEEELGNAKIRLSAGKASFNCEQFVLEMMKQHGDINEDDLKIIVGKFLNHARAEKLGEIELWSLEGNIIAFSKLLGWEEAKVGNTSDLPKLGDIIFSQAVDEKGAFVNLPGHVGFYAGFKDGKFLILGLDAANPGERYGGSENRVQIEAFEASTTRVLSYEKVVAAIKNAIPIVNDARDYPAAKKAGKGVVPLPYEGGGESQYSSPVGSHPDDSDDEGSAVLPGIPTQY